MEATLTVSPNRQYLGILFPTTPATTAPKGVTGKAWSVPMYTGRQAAHREANNNTVIQEEGIGKCTTKISKTTRKRQPKEVSKERRPTYS